MAINKYGDRGIRWVSHGMLRMEVSVMKKLFENPLNKIIQVGQELHKMYSSSTWFFVLLSLVRLLSTTQRMFVFMKNSD
jgi:hypothetical protein